MMRRRWQCLVGPALSLAISATALAQGTTAPPAPPAAPPAAGEPAPPPPTTPTPAQPGTPPQPGKPAPLPPPPGYPQQQPGYPPPGYPPPAYPQQPGYPPPGYSQQPGYPPPGYSQQPGYPPPGYSQQPGYPPPGYTQQPGYPPPGYAYPPNYYARPAPPPPAGKHGFLAMVFLGVNSLAGSTGQNENVGFRLGTIMGGRVNESFSINGEFTLDVLNPKNVPSNVDLTEFELDLAISPLFHVQTGSNVELVVGPKLGIMVYEKDDGGSPVIKGNGYVYGLNAGAFASISRSVSLGGLISFAARKFTEVQDCAPDGTCTTDDNLPGADKVFGITGAILF